MNGDPMDQASCDEELSVESEFARTFRYIDLYLRQKTDLFLQHYVLEPFGFLARQVLFLSVIVTLLVAGTVVLVIGVVFTIATLVPLWAALLITAAIILAIGGIWGYMVVSDRMVLKTPLAQEMVKSGKP
jgi:hypothetical protein